MSKKWAASSRIRLSEDDVQIPIRDGCVVVRDLPRDVTPQEAAKIASVLKALASN